MRRILYLHTTVPVPGTLQFAAANLNDSETNTTHNATITVSRTGSDGAVSVHYATSNGTATGGDYTATSGALNWTDGDAADKTFTGGQVTGDHDV